MKDARPGLNHALVAVALQGIFGCLASFALWFEPVRVLVVGNVLAAVIGASVSFGFYLGRERRQAEEWWGDNRIAPWRWEPRSFRDMGWPLLAVCVGVAIVAWQVRS